MKPIQKEVDPRSAQTNHAVTTQSESTQEDAIQTLNLQLIADFFTDIAPHITAEALQRGHGLLAEYIAMDQNNAGREDLQESLYILRELTETIKQMQEPEKDGEEEENPEEHFSEWVDIVINKERIIIQQNKEIGMLHTFIETLKYQLAQLTAQIMKSRQEN